MLNGLWLGFFLIAAAGGARRAGWSAATRRVFAAMVESLFAMARLSVEVMVLLFGTLTLWLGLPAHRRGGRAGRRGWRALLGPLFRAPDAGRAGAAIRRSA